MLKAVYQNLKEVQCTDEALGFLRQLITCQIQSNSIGEKEKCSKWLQLNFTDTFTENPIFKFTTQLKYPSEYLLLLLALVHHIQPNFFESIIQEHMPTGGDFPEFGGVKGTNHRSMLPTGETAQFILAGTDIEERLKVHEYFSNEHFFYKQNILWLESVREGEPIMSGRIILSQEMVDKILLNKESSPRFGLDFPAKKIVTEMNWEDAVLSQQTAQQVNDISIWLNHHQQLFMD